MSANHPAMSAANLARRGPRKGLAVKSATRPNRAVYDTNLSVIAADRRAPRDGGRQAWHDRANGRPWQTSTGFSSLRPASLR